MDQEGIMYLAATALIAVLIIITGSGYGPLGMVMVILGALTLVIIIMLNYVDFVLFPFFTKTLGITMVPANRYTIPKTQDSVIKLVNGIYYATGYLTGNLYGYVFQSQQEQPDEAAMALAMDKWERVVMNVNFPFKFNVITMSENVQKYRDDLDGQRGYLQFQISREMQSTNPNQMTIEGLQRQMALVQAKMDRVATGERPMNTLIYIESTAVGVSEREAQDALTNQLSQLQTVFNAFDLNIMRITGREVYHLSQMNYRIPGEQELRKIFQEQK